jgi:hypothetical protein
LRRLKPLQAIAAMAWPSAEQAPGACRTFKECEPKTALRFSGSPENALRPQFCPAKLRRLKRNKLIEKSASKNRNITAIFFSLRAISILNSITVTEVFCGNGLAQIGKNRVAVAITRKRLILICRRSLAGTSGVPDGRSRKNERG